MRLLEGRQAGLLVPLFALRSDDDWGIGEIGHIGRFAAWMSATGHGLLAVLPVTEIPPGERSPYAALTAFAIDPIYASVGEVEDFVAAGGVAALNEAEGAALADVRACVAIDYDGIRRLKQRALACAFAQFQAGDGGRETPRAAAFARFRSSEAGWLDDYVLFRVLLEEHGWRWWREWEPGIRERHPDALALARTTHAERCLFHAYVQWQLAIQWERARAAARGVGVRLMGDLPFGVAHNSADVWAQQGEFADDVSLGAPPDAFNAAGQDWGLPPYRWDAMAQNDFAWLRRRAARAAALADAVRIDHVVGFYRMFVIPPRGSGYFVPADEGEQLALGERLLRVVLEAAAPAAVIGEDLGVVPDFVRASLARLGVAGYRVLRWEADADRFRDPGGFPACSLATSGTHDTSALATWWTDELDDAGRRALAEVPGFEALRAADGQWTAAVHTSLLQGLYDTGSDLVVLPFPDAYGGRERINLPATMGEANWSYRLPWTLEGLETGAGDDLRVRLTALARRHERAP